MLPKIWKKLLISGVVIPAKIRFCNECNDKIVCDRCNNQGNKNEEFEANRIVLKRQAPNHVGDMLPYYKY